MPYTFLSHGFSEFSFEKNVIPFFSELCRCNSMVLTRIQKGENLFPLALQFHFIEREQSPIWTRDEHCIECTCSSSVPPRAKNIYNVPFCSMYSSIRMNVDLSWLMIRASLITQSRGTDRGITTYLTIFQSRQEGERWHKVNDARAKPIIWYMIIFYLGRVAQLSIFALLQMVLV